MFKWHYRAAFLLLVQVLSGCASGHYLSSSAITSGGDGTYYALPRVYVPISLKRVSGALTVTPGPQLLHLPDPNFMFRLTLEHSWITTDHVFVGTTETGLLTTINGDSTDQTATALNQVITLAGEVAKAGAALGGPSGVATAGKPNPDEARDFAYDIDLDPTDTHTSRWSEAVAFLSMYGVSITAQPVGGDTDSAGAAQVSQAQFATCSDSICFRPARPYELAVRQTASSLSPVVFRFLVVAPDPTKLLSIRVDRQILSRAEVKLTFCNGMLTNYETTKNSEITALLQVPIDAVSKIAAIPGQILTVRVENNRNQENLLQGQANLLNAQATFVAAQAKAAAEGGQTAPPKP